MRTLVQDLLGLAIRRRALIASASAWATPRATPCSTRTPRAVERRVSAGPPRGVRRPRADHLSLQNPWATRSVPGDGSAPGAHRDGTDGRAVLVRDNGIECWSSTWSAFTPFRRLHAEREYRRHWFGHLPQDHRARRAHRKLRGKGTGFTFTLPIEKAEE